MYSTFGMFRGATASTPGATIYPTFVSRTHSSTGTGTIARSITLPSSITVGQRIVIIVSLASGSVTTPPSGYTQIGSQTIYHKSASGSEGSTVVSFNLSTSSTVSNQSAWVFDNASQIEAASLNASTSDGNPPSLTVSWGADNNLFMASFHQVGIGVSTSGYPTNCTLYRVDDDVGALSESIAGAESTLATFNPDAFGSSSGEHWVRTIGLTA